MSETFFTLFTLKDCDPRAAPVACPLLFVPAVGELAPAAPEEELFAAEFELFDSDGEALCDAEAAPDCVPRRLTSSFTCLLSSELSPANWYAVPALSVSV